MHALIRGCVQPSAGHPPYRTAGDHLYRMDYREFVAAHRAAGADITVAALPCAEEQAQAFGLMKIDDRWGGRRGRPRVGVWAEARRVRDMGGWSV